MCSTGIMSLPYITANLAGVGGKLRTLHEHFIVEEIPLYLPTDEGTHLYLNIRKVGLTTREVADRLERLFEIQRGDVGFAGLKDKDAVTTQTFSLPINKPDALIIAEIVRRVSAELPVQVNWARLHRNKLKSGHLLGNRFTIFISELSIDPQAALQRAQQIRAKIQAHGLPNFFGPQRFGRSGDNFLQGQEILQGKRHVRDRWLRLLLISSFQSLLCNRYLTQRVEAGLFDRLVNGDIAKKHATGGMFDVTDLTVDQARFEAQEISFTAPMFGYKMRQGGGEAGLIEQAILAESTTTEQQWRRAHVEGTRRLGRLLVPDLDVSATSASANEHGLSLSFSLPKGAFATTLLREFMKNESVDSEQEIADIEE